MGYLTRGWAALMYWYSVLRPARASLLIVGLTWLIFVKVPQGEEILRRVGSRDHINWEGTKWHHGRFMLGALFVLGLTSWAWARFLLNCNFPGTPQSHHHRESTERVRRCARVACGVAPPLCVAWVFGRIWLHTGGSGSEAELQYGRYALGCLGLTLALYLFFKGFHHYQKKQSRIQRYSDRHDIYADRRTLSAIIVTYLLSLIAFVLLTMRPVAVGSRLGAAAVLLLALAWWIVLGSAVVYFGSRYRLPVVTLALLWVVGVSSCNDNHPVRVLKSLPDERPQLRFEEALERWKERLDRKSKPEAGKRRPLFLVAAAGGGIRAAYWTAIVLGHLEDRAQWAVRASFAEHTFALSGVSGGALGMATFDALKASKLDARYRDRAEGLLEDDFLAADLARMGFADLAQRFLPGRCEWCDRAASLEDAWAAPWDVWEKAVDGNPMNQSLGNLFARAQAQDINLPHLLLNGTSVETGRRIITSDLDIRTRSREDSHGEFIDAIIGAEELESKPIRLSTAAHQSARFTFFSPAGRFADGTRIVDGGYFENSGAATLMEALDAVRHHIATHTSWSDIEPLVILIDNEPISKDKPRPRPVQLLHETLSPLIALLNTRDARGSYAQQRARVYRVRSEQPAVFEFHLHDRNVALPLGWTLSGRAVAEMNYQLTNAFDRVDNEKTCTEILAHLPPRQ